MNLIAVLFNRMDEWRHFPNYQLERRADLLFSLYLPEALEQKLGRPVLPTLIPEFPVRIGTIYPEVPINRSFKVDYVALAEDRTKAVLVELKTDTHSRRTKQDRYLEAARDAGLERLLEGLLQIFRATESKRKYFRLLRLIEDMGLLRIPESVKRIVARRNLQGINEASRGIEIVCPTTECEIIYLQPEGTGGDVLNFTEFAKTVRSHPDPISQRFAQSLEEWARVEPGATPSTEPWAGQR
jgi:hypothetical protein